MNAEQRAKLDEKLKAIETAKYALHFATDVTKPPGAAPSEMVSFRSRFGMLWFLLRNKQARDAIRAGRFQFFKIVKGKK